MRREGTPTSFYELRMTKLGRRVMRRYRAGEGSPAIGADLGIDHSSICTFLRNAGVKMRPRGAPKKRAK